MYFNFQQYLFSTIIPSLQKKKTAKLNNKKLQNKITKNFKTKISNFKTNN